jgi:uncharacterized protein
MFVDLSRIEGGRLEERFFVEPASPAAVGFEPEIPEPLVLDVEVRNPSGGTYVVTGSLSGTVLAECRRCLTPTSIPLDIPLRVVFQEGRRDAERDDEPGDDDIVWIERGAKRLELDEQVRDLLFLETERFPLCRPDCKGVCPRCGQDLNAGSCDCTFEAPDSRWKALEGLRSAESE